MWHHGVQGGCKGLLWYAGAHENDPSLWRVRAAGLSCGCRGSFWRAHAAFRARVRCNVRIPDASAVACAVSWRLVFTPVSALHKDAE